jgi:hypothetical protein
METVPGACAGHTQRSTPVASSVAGTSSSPNMMNSGPPRACGMWSLMIVPVISTCVPSRIARPISSRPPFTAPRIQPAQDEEEAAACQSYRLSVCSPVRSASFREADAGRTFLSAAYSLWHPIREVHACLSVLVRPQRRHPLVNPTPAVSQSVS